ncbi:hypothetical protein C8Q79DRAFT_1120411 [Trametes meyenii]|nr:hypothetical protein C8Q79DRAFT_1120411 [Trametes meyenii]
MSDGVPVAPVLIDANWYRQPRIGLLGSSGGRPSGCINGASVRKYTTMPIIPSPTSSAILSTEMPMPWTYSILSAPITTGRAQARLPSSPFPHDRRSLPDTSTEDGFILSSRSRERGVRLVFDKTTRPSAPNPTVSDPVVVSPIIARAQPLETTVITVNDATCQFALDLLRDDYAGHGLPLTSLVIESSTFLMLAGFVFYCIWHLRRRVSHQRRLCTTAKSVLPAYAFTNGPPHKHIRPTRARPSGPDPDEAPYPPSPTQSTLSTQFSPLSAKPPPLSPMRGTPGSPLRRAFHSLSFASNSNPISSPDPGELQKEPSFLLLRG